MTDSKKAIFNLDYLNTDCNVRNLEDLLKNKLSGSILLYGPPGTGKTAFARHIAEIKGSPLIAKKPSEILGMERGGTERNIARIFEDAEKQYAVILFDQAEWLMRDHRGAHNPLEESCVAELLMQMENFEGTLFFCANNLDGVDQAFFMRFALKIKFGYLKPEQSMSMLESEFNRISAPFADEGSMKDAKWIIRQINNLTPGDFINLGRRLELLKITNPSSLVIALRLSVHCEEKRWEDHSSFLTRL
jgi:SpoVK/Ycf46/Vps4 family AAA+-type ATPase